MKVKIEKKELNELLDRVYPIVPSKTTMPVLSSILIEAKESTFYVSATDLECSITTNGKAEVEEEGKIALSGKELYSIVKELPNIPLEIDVTELIATIRCGGKYTLPGISAEEFPQLLIINEGTKTHLPIDVLKRGIDKTLFATSTTDPGSVLRNCLLDLHTGEFRLVATDGHKLAIFKSKTKTEQSAQLLIPPKAWKEVANFTSGVDIVFDESKISFSSENTILTARLQEGGFPPYESVIPTDNDKELTVTKEDLLACIRRAIVFSPDASKLLKLKLAPNQLTVESASEGGEGHEEVKCKFKGEGFDIGYNASYLTTILGKIESEEAKFMLGGPETAAIITPKTKEKEVTYLLMPIRLT